MQTPNILALHPIGTNDYAVIDDGNVVGRIRHASERTNERGGFRAFAAAIGRAMPGF